MTSGNRLIKEDPGGGLSRPHGQENVWSGVDSDDTPKETPPTHPGAIHEIRRKALSGAALVAGRNIAIKATALLGNVVLARLLSPSSFGAIAFGMTILLFVQLLSDGGLGVGLIRRPEEPHPDDLRVLLGYQLVLTLAFAVVIASVALAGPFGEPGLVTAIMMPALPLLSFRAPSSIVFERSLNYGPLVRVEIVEEVTYYVWGIAMIVLGAGVWGLATASVVKALVGTLVMLTVSPVARLLPHYSWQRLKPMLGFGIKFQAVGLANTAVTQFLNLGVAAVGGLAALGLWNLASRVLQIPSLLFTALWRVSYPAAAQLLSAGESARKMIERGLVLSAVATGLILAPAIGSMYRLIPAMFGHRWAPVVEVFPPIFFALQVTGPISIATVGYLYAVGDTSTVLRATVAIGVVWLAVSLPLLSPLGLVALGIGGMASAFAEAIILSQAVQHRTGAAVFRCLLIPWVSASFGGVSGWFVSRVVSHGFIAAFLGAAVALCIYVVPIVLLRRDDLLTIMELGLRGIRSDGGPIS